MLEAEEIELASCSAAIEGPARSASGVEAEEACVEQSKCRKKREREKWLKNKNAPLSIFLIDSKNHLGARVLTLSPLFFSRALSLSLARSLNDRKKKFQFCFYKVLVVKV